MARCLRATLAVGYVTIAILAVASVSPRVSAGPSQKLEAALSQQLPGLPDQDMSTFSRLKEVFRQAKRSDPELCIKWGYEYEVEKPGDVRKISLSAGSLRQQLDAVAKGHDYVWEAEGDWINLIPRCRAVDPDYIMNQRIPGKVVHSRDPTKATSVKEWFATRHIVSARYVHAFEFKKPDKSPEPMLGPDPIVLENPTLRQSVNAHETLYGADAWTAQIKVVPGKEGQAPRVLLLVADGLR